MKELLRKLEANPQLHQRIIEHVRDGLFLFTLPEGRFVYANASACENLGYEEDELLEKTVLDVETRFEILDDFHRIVRDDSKEGRRIHGTHVRKDGSTFPVAVEFSRIELDGETYGLAVSRDVSERRRTLRELRQVEERFRQFDEHLEQVLWMISPDSNDLLYVSIQFEDIWGYPPEELQENPKLWMDVVLEQDQPRVRAFLEQLRSSEAGDDGREIRYRIERPDGEVRWIRDRGFPIRDKDGTINRLAGVAEDVTDRFQRQRQNKRRDKLKSIGDMAAKVMHEINNPNAAIQGNVEYLKRAWEKLESRSEPLSTESDPVLESIRLNVPEVLESLERSTMTIEQLVDDVKQFARDSGVRGDRVYELSDPCGLPEEVLSTYRRERESVPVVVDCELTDSVKTSVSREKLKLVLDHLIDNALKATAETNQPRVEVALRRNNGSLVVSVRDNGPGIPEEEKERVTDLFYSTRDESVGTGLGLSIVATVVEQAGGDLNIRGQEGDGTTVEVVLPLVTAAE